MLCFRLSSTLLKLAFCWLFICRIQMSLSSAVDSSLLQPLPTLPAGYRARGCSCGEQQAFCGKVALPDVGQVSPNVICPKDLKVIQGIDPNILFKMRCLSPFTRTSGCHRPHPSSGLDFWLP